MEHYPPLFLFENSLMIIQKPGTFSSHLVAGDIKKPSEVLKEAEDYRTLEEIKLE